MIQLTGIGQFLGHILGYEVVRNGLQKLGEISTEQVKKLLDESLRRDAGHGLRLLEQRNPHLASVLAQRLRRAEETGEPVLENDIIRAIGHLLPRDKDGKLDDDGAVEMLEQFATMPEERFAALMRAMKHDVFAQKARLFIQRYGAAAFAAAFNFLDAAADEFATALEPLANRLHQKAIRKGLKSWLDC